MARTATKPKAANPTDAVLKALRGDDTDLRAVLATTYRYGAQEATEGLILTGIVKTGIVKAAPDIGDVQDEAVAWAAENAGELIGGLDKTHLAAVQTILARAVERGWTDTYTGQQINKLIGLNSQQALAVDNYRAQMLKDGVPPGTAQRRSDDYAKRLQRRHAKSIAANEIRAAYMAGQRQAWHDARDLGDVSPYAVRIVRVAKDERACSICKPLNGRRTSLVGGTYPVKVGSTLVNMAGPPFHPNCRCIEVLQDLPMGDVPGPHPVQKHLPGRHNQKSHGGGGHIGMIRRLVPKVTFGGEFKSGQGFTVGYVTGFSPKDGFMVALDKTTEQRFGTVDEVTPAVIQKWMRKNRAKLREPNAYIGAWTYKGDLWLDVSTRFSPDQKTEALAAAKKADQEAIFDISIGDEIIVRKNQRGRVIYLRSTATPEEVVAIVQEAFGDPIQKGGVRRVRTLAGSRRYNLPIGAPIVAKPDVPKLPSVGRSKPWDRKVVITDRQSDPDFFRRFNRGTKHDFTTSKTTYGTFEVSEKQKAHTKQGVARNLRDRIKKQDRWGDEVDKVDWSSGYELDAMGVPISGFSRREQPSLKYDGQEAHDAWLRGYVWPEIVGIDELKTDTAKADRLADNLDEAFRRIDKYRDRLYDLGIWPAGDDPTGGEPDWDKEVKAARKAVDDWRAWDVDTPGEKSSVIAQVWSNHRRLAEIFDSIQMQVNEIGNEDDRNIRAYVAENPDHDGIPDHVRILAQDEHFIFSNQFSSERVLKTPTVSVPAEDLPDGLSSKELDREVKLAALTRAWIDQWASSSNGESPASHAFQRAVAVWSDEKFGTAAGRLDKLKARHVATHTYSDQDLKTHGRFLAMHLIPAIYDETQEFLKDQDIDSLRLYRGMKFDSRPAWVPDLADDSMPAEDAIKETAKNLADALNETPGVTLNFKPDDLLEPAEQLYRGRFGPDERDTLQDSIVQFMKADFATQYPDNDPLGDGVARNMARSIVRGTDFSGVYTRSSRKVSGVVDDVDFESNPASSWAVMPHTARGFSSSLFPVVATMDVPREMILSTSVSGIGALDENEVVVIGWTRPGRAYWFDSHNAPGMLPGAEDILVEFHGKQPLSDITDKFLESLED